MQPSKIQTVHNYLTPKKILTSLLNPSHKSNLNRSLTQQINNVNVVDSNLSVHSSTPKRQRQSYKKKGTYPIQDNEIKEQSAHDFIMQQNQEPAYEAQPRKFSENIDFIRVHNQNGTSSRISRGSGNSIQQLQNQSKPGKFETSSPFTKNDNNRKYSQLFKNQNKSQISQMGSSTRKFIVPNKANPQISRLAIQDTINKLTEVRNNLQTQISELKKLLDDTSTSLQRIDQQYQNFKEKIIAFTSKALDSAYRQYKKNLPNWSIYENIQQSGINKIQQVNQAIELCQNQEKLKQYGGKQILQKKASGYQQFIKQVHDARKQCLAQRPIISEDKIKKFQSVLRQIGQF